jgi:putative oxygen-independent coproporphyrinogen III oxidase
LNGLPESPPLSLYAHIPWCLQKCPYCDFNSHAVTGDLDESTYVTALLRDLDSALPLVGGRELISIFIGGGTPSLFSGAAIGRMLDGIESRMACAAGLEVTLEANPGTVDQGHFKAYRQAGVNRISIGVQSFAPELLQRLGRIHGPDEAVAAVAAARLAGMNNLNLDLMYALPGQTLEQARHDLATAISLEPEHISYYQLTLEANTRFHAAPPVLPDDDRIGEMEAIGHELLDAAGYRQYEVSAFARAGFECRHNRNYWEFGDYLGIGAGAHGKISDSASGQIGRTRKVRSPDTYLQTAGISDPSMGIDYVTEHDLPLEFMLNTLRLKRGFSPGLFERRTGLPLLYIQQELNQAVARGLLELSDELIRPTITGGRFLNELLDLFVAE